MLALLASVVVMASTAQASTNVSIDVGGGAKRTARAVRSAVTERGLDGTVWLGKLRGVGGGRDTLVYVPNVIDTTRTIDVVIYMEGIGSFDDEAPVNASIPEPASVIPVDTPLIRAIWIGGLATSSSL